MIAKNGKKIVIGLAGVKTAGKSTVTNIISEFFNIKESALADRLKNVSAKVFGLQRIQFDEQSLKEIPFENPVTLTMEMIGGVLEGFGVYLSDKNGQSGLTVDNFIDLVGMKLDSPRKIAQIVGTEILRRVDEDIHCKSVMLHDDAITVISDVRFPNEYDYFSKNPNIVFIPLYISRKLAEDQVTEDSHISERLVFTFRDKCKKIDNNGSISETEIQVKKAIDEELYGR